VEPERPKAFIEKILSDVSRNVYETDVHGTPTRPIQITSLDGSEASNYRQSWYVGDVACAAGCRSGGVSGGTVSDG